MISELAPLLRKHQNKGVIIDTNLLLLYLVGIVNPERIEKFKRTAQFLRTDFLLLAELIQKFSIVLATPNILTETYNLGGQLGEPERSNFMAVLATQIEQLEERYITSLDASQDQQFIRFGLTDSGIVAAARQDCLVVTDDFPLVVYLWSQNLDAINFNNLRAMQ